MMSGLLIRVYSCCFIEEPPITTENVIGGLTNFASLSSIDAHWAANSHVGCNIKTHVDLREFDAILDYFRSFQIYFSNIGSKYEAVLPLPVTAFANISFPSNINGITLHWILVGWSYSRAVQALTKGFERNNSWNEIKSSLSYWNFSFFTSSLITLGFVSSSSASSVYKGFSYNLIVCNDCQIELSKLSNSVKSFAPLSCKILSSIGVVNSLRSWVHCFYP